MDDCEGYARRSSCRRPADHGTLCPVKPFAQILFGICIVLSPLALAEPPVAKEHPDLTFHAAAKPLAADAVTQDWPCFLGPTHNAISAEKPLLATFPAAGPPLTWEVKKGSGYSSPAVAAGKVLLLHRVGDNETVDCLEAETGKRFWRFQYPSAYQDRYGYCDGPRAQPSSIAASSFPSAPKRSCTASTSPPAS